MNLFMASTNKIYCDNDYYTFDVIKYFFYVMFTQTKIIILVLQLYS